MKKIKVVGDSILKGVIFDETLNKHIILKDNGIEMLKEAGFDIVNDAKFGLTIHKARQIVERTPLDIDEILLEVGGNDCDYNWDEVSENPLMTHLAKTPILEFESALESLVLYIQSFDIKPTLVSIPPLDEKLFFDFISKDRKKDNILTFLGEKKQIYYHQKKYNEVIEKIAIKYSLKYIPLRETIEKAGSFSDIYCKDGMHLNHRGQTIIFNTFKQYIG